MGKLTIIDAGVLYRNPLPGHQAVIAFGPFILPLSDTELICSFKRGQAMYSRDGMIHLLRSTDGGRTWDHEGPIRDRAKDDRHYQYALGPMTKLRDGSLVLAGCRADRTDPDRFWMNPATGGSIPKQTFVTRSTDGGRSWSDQIVGFLPEPPEGIEPAVGGPVLEMEDGHWMLLFETWKAYDNSGPMDIETYVLFSKDEGHTWTDWTTIADGRSYDRSFSHGHIIQLSNKRLFTLYWTGNAQFSEFFDLHWNTGDPTGKEWTKPITTGIHGQSSYPAEVGPGRIAFIYSQREKTDQPGVKVIMSKDSGQTWDLDNRVVVWDAYGKEALGVPRTDTYPTSHDVIAYGAPHLVRLNEKELMASFWCTQSADTHARFCRLRIE